MVISIIPLLVVGITSYQLFAIVLKEEAGRYSLEIVKNQRDYLDLQLEQIESLIANISGVEEITTVLNEETATIDTYTSLATQARIGYILNGYSNSRVLASIDIFTVGGTHYHVGDTLNVSNIRTDIRDRLFDETLQSDRLIHWSGIENNVNANSAYKKVLPATKVLTHVDRSTLQQEPIALILVNYTVDDLYEHFNQIRLGEGAYMMVIDTSSHIIYHPDKNLIGHPVDESMSNLMADNTPTHLVNIGGEEVFVTHTNSDISGWGIASLIPVATMQSRAITIRNNLIWVLLSIFIIVTFSAWLYNRDTVQPIRQITLRFQQLQAGTPESEMYLPVHNNDEIGELVQWFNTFLNSLDERRKAEAHLEASLKEKEVLLKEIHHRVKNNLQVISSLLNLQSGQLPPDGSVSNALRDSQNRIRSMALIHERLYSSSNLAQVDFSEYVENLTIYLVHSYRIDINLIRLRVNIDAVYLNIETAVPCGLIINELTSNALKHAFPDRRTGEICIDLRQKPDSDILTLIIVDDGIGLPEDTDRTNTLGLQLVDTLVQQLDGTMTVTNNQGTRFEITFEASSVINPDKEATI